MVRRLREIGCDWIGQKLAMGHCTRVTQAVSRLSRQPGRKLEKLKQRVLKVEATV